MPEGSSISKVPVRWLPFQCPSCFGLFRAKREEAGELGRCPGCASRLLIPEPEVASTSTASESSAPEKVTSETKSYAKAEVSEQAGESTVRDDDWNEGPSRRRKRFAGEKAEILDWEEGELTEKKTSIPWIFVISMVMLGGLFVAGGLRFLENAEGGADGVDVVAQTESMLSENNERQKEMVAGAEKEEDETRKMIESFDRFDSTQIRNAIKSFVSAKTVEEKLKFSRASEGIEQKMQHYYGGGDPEVEGFRSIDQTKVVYRGDFISTFVRLKDFLDYPVVVERLGEDDYRVDWESWVGYCEKKVVEMKALKPTKPILIRAVATNENYYNYSFSDDEKWISLKLAFHDEDHTLWAYAERDSKIGQALKVYRDEVESRPFIMRVKYPEKARANDQVIIDEIITDGWVAFPKEE